MKEIKEYTAQMSVLYVEDNDVIREANSGLFKELFKKADVAKDGECGLKQYKTNYYDLVITDINMPKMNGIEMLENINKINSNQPTIIMSAYSEIEYHSRLQYIRVDAFLRKPVALNSLIESIKLCLNKKELEANV